MPPLLSDLHRKPFRAAAALLLLFLFAANVYRAATQSISHDEGVMFGWFLSGGWARVLEFEHGNHHVLADLLSKLSIEMFGLSGFTVRIPALLGGLLYFVSVFAVSALLFGEGALFLLAVAALSLNPFVLDYLVCARGYGPALGLLFFSLYQAARLLSLKPDGWQGPEGRRALLTGGIALGLSVACNPVMLFPATALAGCLVVLLAFEPAPATAPALKVKKSGKRSRNATAGGQVRPAYGTTALLWFALPAGAAAGVFLMLPKRLIELEEGYTGPASILSVVQELVRHSFVHSPSGFAGLASETVIRLATFAVPALLVGLVVAGVVAARSDRFQLLLAALLPATLVLVVASHFLFGMPYPELRTAMYWLPLLTLACLVLARMPAIWIRIPLLAAVALCTAQYATQFNTRYFAEWPYCAAVKEMVGAIRPDGRRVRVGLSWQLEPVVNFYRVAWRLTWMDPVYRSSPDADFDYYLLMNDDRNLIGKRSLKELMRDDLSRVVLARAEKW